MVYISKNIFQKLTYLLAILILLFITKPILLFKKNGRVREYGIGKDSDGYKKTLYTFHIVIIILVIIIFYFDK